MGGAPHVDPDPAAALEFCLRTAMEYAKPLDLHMDETLNPAMLGLADLASLVGEVLGVEQVPITFDVQAGKGRLKIGQNIEAELSPFKGATGKETTLQDTVFTTIPGSPAYPGKASKYVVNEAKYGFNINLTDHNAVQGSFAFEV